ncbi:MAG: alpha/beta hydrolase [Acidobacteria bacterium]|nr:alpha/beta hydrolase [Acidobacteriota bacterium]
MKVGWNICMQILTVLLFAATLSAATVDGIEIHSSVRGAGPETVILVHGWTCDETTWKSQVPALSKDYRVVTLDLPGHGKSGSPAEGDLSLDLFARAIEAVRQEVNVNRVVLAGHSMGTPVVMQYARLYPRHVAGLVFVDGMVALPANLNIDASFFEQFAGPDGLKAREVMIRGMFSSATTPEMQKHILEMMLGAPEGTATGAMKAMFNPEIWKDDVFTQPVLGLYADGSTTLKNENVKRRFPRLDYYEMAGTGHFLMLEKPEEFNRLLLEFLARIF